MRRNLPALVKLLAIAGIALFSLFFLPWYVSVIVTVGPVLALYAMGLALAGSGNRLGWTLIFCVLAGTLVMLAALLRSWSPLDGAAAGVLLCAAVPLVPALVLWSAHAFKARRTLAVTHAAAGGPAPTD